MIGKYLKYPGAKPQITGRNIQSFFLLIVDTGKTYKWWINFIELLNENLFFRMNSLLYLHVNFLIFYYVCLLFHFFLCVYFSTRAVLNYFSLNNVEPEWCSKCIRRYPLKDQFNLTVMKCFWIPSVCNVFLCIFKNLKVLKITTTSISHN